VPYCPNCGNEILTEEKFCHHCGQKINIPIAQYASTETPVSTAPNFEIPIQRQQVPQTRPPQKTAPQIQPPTVQRVQARFAQVPLNQPDWVKEGIRGTARGVQRETLVIGMRSDGRVQEEREVTFRLERIDDAGNIIEIIPVSTKFCRKQSTGSINDGDTVVVLGSQDSSGLFVVRKLYNKSMNYEFKLKPKGGWIISLVLALIAVVTFFFHVHWDTQLCQYRSHRWITLVDWRHCRPRIDYQVFQEKMLENGYSSGNRNQRRSREH